MIATVPPEVMAPLWKYVEAMWNHAPFSERVKMEHALLAAIAAAIEAARREEK